MPLRLVMRGSGNTCHTKWSSKQRFYCLGLIFLGTSALPLPQLLLGENEIQKGKKNQKNKAKRIKPVIKGE